MDAKQLQVVVDRAKCKIEDDKEVWYLTEDDAKEFVACVDKYIKKSVGKSDLFDPEDAYGEIVLELWRCLTKYGPRPNGKLFGEYVLPLKTNNILTNRANKRKSFKSRINYLTSSIDDVRIDSKFFEGPLDKVSTKENIMSFQKKIDEDKKIQSLYKRIKRETELLSKSSLELFTSLYMDFLLKSNKQLAYMILNKINNLNKVEKSNSYLYNKGKAFCLEDNMKEVKIGDKLITPYGKIIEIRRKTEDGYVVHIPLIDQEAEVDLEYIDKCTIFDSSEEELAQPEETKQLKVYAKKIVEDEKKSLDNIVIDGSDSGAATKVIIELLKHGSQTRELLARALVSKGLTKSNDVEKAKGYVSVLISNLKKEGSFKIESPKRGVYELVA